MGPLKCLKKTPMLVQSLSPGCQAHVLEHPQLSSCHPQGLTQQTSQALSALALAAAFGRPVRLRAAVLAAMLGVGGQREGGGRCCPFGSGFACWRRCH